MIRQFEPSRELPAQLARANVTAEEIGALATRLAEFHRHAAAPDDVSFDYAWQFRDCVLGNVATLLTHLSSLKEIPVVGALIDWTDDSLFDLHEPLRERQARGRIRECHAHNICAGTESSRRLTAWNSILNRVLSMS